MIKSRRGNFSRHAYGEKAPNAKLSNADIPLIRALRTDGVPVTAIAAKFGVSRRTIYRILRDDTWTHV